LDIKKDKLTYVAERIVYFEKKRAEFILNSKHVNRQKIKKVWRGLNSNKIVLINLQNFLDFVILKRINNEEIKL
jgi:hypothetical protein